MQSYQIFVLENADLERLILHHLEVMIITTSMGQSTSNITADIVTGLMSGSVTVNWIKVLEAFLELLKQCTKDMPILTSRQLINTPYILANPKVAGPPVDIGKLSGTAREKMVCFLYF